MVHSVCQQIWKTQQWLQTKKVSFHSNPKEGQWQSIFKLPHNCTHLTCLQSNAQNSPSQTSIICNCELPNAHAGFSKDRGARDQIANICWIIENQESSWKKYLPLLYWPRQCLWLCRSQQTGKFLKRWEYQTTLLASWETCMQVKKQQLELDMEQRTGSKLIKEYVKAIYCHLAYLTYMQSTSCEMLGWMKHKLEWRLLGEISITSDMQMTPSLWQKVKN